MLLVDYRCDSLQKVLLSAPRYVICQAKLVASGPMRIPSPEERLVSALRPDIERGRVLLEAN